MSRLSRSHFEILSALHSIPHTSENKSRRFPLTYSQRCETIFAPSLLLTQQTSRSKRHQEPCIPVPHAAFPCCRHECSPQSASEAPWANDTHWGKSALSLNCGTSAGS